MTFPTDHRHFSSSNTTSSSSSSSIGKRSSSDVWIEIVQKKTKKKYSKLQIPDGKKHEFHQLECLLDLALRCSFDESGEFFEKAHCIVRSIFDDRLEEHEKRRRRLILEALQQEDCDEIEEVEEKKGEEHEKEGEKEEKVEEEGNENYEQKMPSEPVQESGKRSIFPSSRVIRDDDEPLEFQSIEQESFLGNQTGSQAYNPKENFCLNQSHCQLNDFPFERITLETTPFAFKPNFSFWIPVSKSRAYGADQPPMFEFIPYFGDEKGISRELAEFLEQTLDLMHPPSPEEAIEHQIIGEIMAISQCSASRLQAAWTKSETECTKREFLFSRFLQFCFPEFDENYLEAIEKTMPKSLLSLEKLDPIKLFHRAFRCHFCRKCYRFGCLEHNDAVFPATLPANLAKRSELQLSMSQDFNCLNCYKFQPQEPVDLQLNAFQDEIIKKSLSLGFTPCKLAAYLEIECAKLYPHLKVHFPDLISSLESNVNYNQDFPIRAVSPPSASSSSSKTQLKKYPIDIEANQRVPHVPCYHPGKACNQNCACVSSNLYCEKYCFCSEGCSNRFPGCNCTGPCINTSCPCYAAIRECDPDLCKKCCSTCPSTGAKGIFGTKKCRNSAIQQSLFKRIAIGESFVDGLGAFAAETIKESELICEYLGERVPEDEAERRGRIYDDYGCSYLFKLDREHTIDATIIGSAIKFANHSNVNQNCYAKVVSVKGEYRIGIYALRNICKGEELLFDYGYRKDQKKFVSKDLPGSSSSSSTTTTTTK